VTLFFWLTGLLLGLALRRARRFGPLLAAGVGSYYLTWALTRWIPFHVALYPAAAACSVVSGLLPGCFFRRIGQSYAPIRRPLFHENNGFVLGLLVALKGAVHFGGWLLAAGPAVGAALVVVGLAAAGRHLEHDSARVFTRRNPREINAKAQRRRGARR
jgi:hypothetical protein